MSGINNTTKSQWSEANKFSETFIQIAQKKPDFLSELSEDIIGKMAQTLWKMKI